MMSHHSNPSNPAINDQIPSSASKKTASFALKCPRCDSTNTKFCYYNNYSLSQPRHFCKTCRRYWTNGGALRTVPIGGGCRKNKKLKSSKPDSSGSSSKFFHKASPPIDFLFPSSYFMAPMIHQNMNSNLAIQSLSSLNQDLHWKLQQQRLGMMDQSCHQKDEATQKLLQPILFQNLEVQKQEISCFNGSVTARNESAATEDAATEWFFGNSYASDSVTPSTTRSNGGNDGWNGIQAWEDLHQFSTLP